MLPVKCCRLNSLLSVAKQLSNGVAAGFVENPSGFIAVAGVRNWKVPPKYKEVEFPVRRRLKVMERVPSIFNVVRPYKTTKSLMEMRGPELIHNKLIHKQFGIQAQGGGRMKYGHYEMARLYINRKMDESCMFAMWRIDAPWKSITKKGLGKRMGGGKGSIDHYVTPIRDGRIILEMAGYCDFEEVEPYLSRVAAKMPFKARVVTQEMLEQEGEKKTAFEEANINPFTFEYALNNNMLGFRKYAGPMDYVWYGSHR